MVHVTFYVPDEIRDTSKVCGLEPQNRLLESTDLGNHQ